MTIRTLVLAALLALAFAEASHGATVDVVGDDEAVRYVAAAGEANDLTFTEIEESWPSAFLVTDPGATITVGRGCVSVDAHRAACIARSGSMFRLRAQLLDGDDVLHPAGFELVRANGGPGDDRLYGGTWDDHLDGGGGSDELRGGEGDDQLSDGDGDGTRADADVLDGGGDRDTVSYERRAEPVTVDLSDPGPDGAAGEADLVIGIEAVHGGRGDDRLIGDGRSNEFTDEGGDNRIAGGGGADSFRVRSGRIECGGGADELRGVTRRALLSPDCETVLRSWEDDDFVVPAYPRATKGGLTLRMKCPSYDGEPIPCFGSVTVTAGSRTLAHGDLRPRAGRRVARLRLTPAGRRMLARRRVEATIAITGRGLPNLSWSVILGRTD